MTGLRLRRFWPGLLVVGAIALSAPGVAGAAFPGRDGRISYIEDIRGRIVSVYLGGGHDRVLASPPHGGAGTSAYKPDGRRILFDTETLETRSSTALYLKRASGRGRARRLTRPFDPHGRIGADFAADWSPDGQSFVFVRDYTSFSGPPASPKVGLCASAWFCIRIYHRGRTRPLVAYSRESLTWDAKPVWSVRGWIAFLRGGDIWVIRPDGSGERRLVNTSDYNGSLDWSPNGRRLVLVENSSELVTVGADGRHLRHLGRHGHDPAYSPDGRRIVYQGTGGNRNRLWTIDLHGGTRRLVRTRYGAVGPDWQPRPRRHQR